MVTEDSKPVQSAMSKLAQARAAANADPAVESDEVKEARRILFDTLAEIEQGKDDPWLKRTVVVLVRKSTRHVVYLDQNNDVQWWWARRPDDTAGISQVQAEVTRLSNDSSFLRHLEFATPWLSRMQPADQSNREALAATARERLGEIRALLAEAIAHALDTNDLPACQKILKEAELQIVLEKDRRCRPMFIEYFLAFTLLALSILAVTWSLHYTRVVVVQSFVVNWLSAGAAGVFGALISAVSRSAELKLEPRSGRSGLRTEALARAILGFGAGFLTGLGFDAGLISGIFKPEAFDAARIFLTTCAGASERILPTLIGKADTIAAGKAGPVTSGADAPPPTPSPFPTVLPAVSKSIKSNQVKRVASHE